MGKDKGPDEEWGDVLEAIRHSVEDPSLVTCRTELAHFAADTFAAVGRELHTIGHIIGSDRVTGSSPWGHGTDETVAISVLLRIATQLVSASADLFADGRPYAAAALTRQLVEVEYLAWAFEARDREGERWLRSSRQERELFFRPAKLRKAASGRFRSQDYGYHCELGGHPVPGGTALLRSDDPALPQLLLADTLGHVGRIWDHILGWARNSLHGKSVTDRAQAMSQRFADWKSLDPLASLPPPPTTQVAS